MSVPLSIAVFAHNEERNIRAGLTGLLASGIGPDVPIHVLANGCTDGTERVVHAFAASHPQVRLHSIGLGDKSNAWNHYVHEIRVDAAVHCFVDGDVEVVAGAFDALVAALREDPSANAATGVPASGRHRDEWLAALASEGGLAGNLYALRGSFIERIRAMNVRVPVGTIGEDGFVGAMAAFDLDPARGWTTRRIAVAFEGRFRFDSIDWRNPDDLRLYARRRVRYALRDIQNRILERHVKAHGFASLPAHIRIAYRAYPEFLRLRWKGLDTVFLFLALRRIHDELAHHAAPSAG